MKIIGITGKSGSGKTTFALSLANKLSCKYVDIDKIGHEATYRPEILNSLCNKFGNEILDETGKLNRKKLGNIVFADKHNMDILTELTWEYMQSKLDCILSQANNIIILDWLLLPISKYWEKCDYKILVRSKDVTRKNKVMERDNISEEYFNKRDSSSIDYSNVKFDYIFENDYQLQTLNSTIKQISEIILKS